MQTLGPTDAGYDDARQLFNRMIDRRPAVIARCESPADVAEALALARTRELDVAVRSGGHSVSGLSTNDGGLVVDVRPMDRVEVDPDRRTMRVGAGANWGQIDAATQAHGLAVTGGRATSTGVAGYTLGGGDGWLARTFGLACDNLLAVDLVTASGREVRASETENSELFWALHGGGGNFGVATAFEFRLHPLGPEILCGLAAWPLDGADGADGAAAVDVARAYRDLMPDAPEALGGGIMVTSGDDTVPVEFQGRSLLLVIVCYAGDPDEGRELLAPVLTPEPPPLDYVAVQPYTQLQQDLTDPPGYHHYWSADYHDRFEDDALDVFLRAAAERPSPLVQQVLFPWGGAIAHLADGETPLSHRQTPWVTHPFAVWERPEDTEANIAWVRRFRSDIAPFTSGGVYLNYIGGEGRDRVRAAFGDETYARLQQVKAEYDPDNVLRGNQNIRPA
ncbi:MAG TPA: FAD-binding oxidoreductase [Jiangellales bacterium]|nr:FAD-binding oxidoreductase [Jiangellales bacterium]